MEKVKIRNICEVINGSTPSTKKSENYNGNIIWITPKDLSTQKNRYIFQGERTITEKGYKECSTTLLPKGSILLSSRAPIGLLAIAGVECCTNQGFKNLVVNKQKIDNLYLYYLLKYRMNEIKALGGGTTFSEVSKSSLENHQINIHALSTQKEIAYTLSILDEKIELNNKMNAELESLARTIYDYWFVQFDFPNADGKPYKASGGEMEYNEKLKRDIPNDWNAKKLSDIVKNISVGVVGGEKLKGMFYTPLDEIPMRKMSFYGGRNYKEAKSSLIRYSENDILFGAMRVYFHRVCISSQSGITRTTTIILRPKNSEYLPYAYQVVNSNSTIEYCVKHSAKSQQPYVNWENELEHYCFAMPQDDKLISRYSEMMTPIVETIKKNEKENFELTALRDFLLPMLMNGQVTVGDVTRTESKVDLFSMPTYEEFKNKILVAARDNCKFDEITFQSMYKAHYEKVNANDKPRKKN